MLAGKHYKGMTGVWMLSISKPHPSLCVCVLGGVGGKRGKQRVEYCE